MTASFSLGRPTARLLSMGLAAGLALGLASTAALADTGNNALPDCYQFAQIKRQTPASVQTELFVVIDQTTPFSSELRQSLAQQIGPLLSPGNALSVFAFSAYTQGYYTRRLLHARMDTPMSADARDGAGKALLQKLDQCLVFQKQGIHKLTQEALVKILSQASSSIAKSDVLGSLKDISTQVQASPAQRKIVLLASDMLENSSVSSFYSSKAVRRIDVATEWKKVESNQLTADFGGAQIYVLGAGLIDSDTQKNGVYRDPQTMNALRAFWEQYFTASHAKLAGFGTPDLLGKIQ
ncbi:hypothetical protein [Comamonas sp.]|uniref:hypothetical protein n=1 Tax=Comamonas sp. TaxID=34028 RepID=UPI003A8E5FA1